LKNVLVTGATGFVGRAVVCQLSTQSDVCVRAAVRRSTTIFSQNIKQVLVGDLLIDTEYADAFASVDVIVHAAARVHVMQDDVADPLAEFRKVNVDGTLNLAKQAAAAGVKRFIFISSIKVNGEGTKLGERYHPNDNVSTQDPYGLSKWEAEQGLFQLSKVIGMEITVIRPPLIYGPGVKANFQKMVTWVNKGVPLPLGAVHNRRSLLALDNLVSFIVCCIDHPKAANEVFLLSDCEDVSTKELLQKVAKALGKRSCLLPVPEGLMRWLASMLGKQELVNRLFCSLEVDSSKACDLLGWKPAVSMDAQLEKMFEANV